MTKSGPYSDVIWIVNDVPPERFGSNRIMAIMPAETLGGSVAVFEADMDTEQFLNDRKPQLLIMMKNFDGALLRLAQAASERNIPVMSVFCDWRYNNPKRPEWLEDDRTLAQLSRKVIVQTPVMRAEVTRLFGVDASIIEEPIYLPPGTPAFSPGRIVKLFWCGHPTNFDTLPPAFTQLARFEARPFSLTLMAESPPPMSMIRAVKWPKTTQMQTERFSLQAQAAGFAACDLAIIPTLSEDLIYKAVKPAGRLVAAIQSGRFAIVHDHPAHRDLADYCWCGEDLAQGVRWALGHRIEVMERLRKGQEHVRARFSMETIAKNWRQQIDEALQRR